MTIPTVKKSIIFSYLFIEIRNNGNLIKQKLHWILESVNVKCTIISFIFNLNERVNTVASTTPSGFTPDPDLEDFTTIEASLLLASGFLI